MKRLIAALAVAFAATGVSAQGLPDVPPVNERLTRLENEVAALKREVAAHNARCNCGLANVSNAVSPSSQAGQVCTVDPVTGRMACGMPVSGSALSGIIYGSAYSSGGCENGSCASAGSGRRGLFRRRR